MQKNIINYDVHQILGLKRFSVSFNWIASVYKQDKQDVVTTVHTYIRLLRFPLQGFSVTIRSNYLQLTRYKKIIKLMITDYEVFKK